MKKRLLAIALSAVLALQPTIVTLADDYQEHQHELEEAVEAITDAGLYEAAEVQEYELQAAEILPEEQGEMADEDLVSEEQISDDSVSEDMILEDSTMEELVMEELIIEGIEEVEDISLGSAEDSSETVETEPLTQEVTGTVGTVSYELSTDGILSLTGSGTVSSQGWGDYRGYVKKAVIDDGITIIDANTFAGCDALEQVTLPVGTTSIGYKAFLGCDQLTTVNYTGTKEQWEAISIAYGNADLRRASAHGISASGTTGTIGWSLTGNTLVLSGSGAVPEPSTDDGSGSYGAAWCRYDDVIHYIYVGSGITDVKHLLRAENTEVKAVYFYGNKPTQLFDTETTPYVEAYYPDANQTWDNEEMEEESTADWIPYCSLSADTGAVLHPNLTYGTIQLQTDVLTANQDSTNFMQIPTETNKAYRMKSCAACGMKEAEDLDCVHGIDVSSVESDHPYSTETNTSWTFGMEDAAEIVMTFDEKTNLETNYDDFLYVYARNGELFGKYKNDELAGKTLYVPGNAVTITLDTDYSTEKYGFKLTQAYGDTHQWDEGTVIKDPYGTQDGEIEYTCKLCSEKKLVEVEARYIVMGNDGEAAWGIMKDGTLEITRLDRYDAYNEKTIGGVSVTTAPWGEYYHLIKKLSLNFKTETTLPYRAFLGMVNLESIDLGDKITKIPNFAFQYCTALKSVVVPEGVTEIGHCAFENCTSLESVTLPYSLETIESSVFYNCYNIDTAYLPSLDRWLEVNLEYELSHPFGSYDYAGDGILYMGGELVEILDIPESVTEIKKHHFVNCKGIKQVTLHEGIVSIGEGVFKGCTNMKLSRDKLPNALTYLGGEAFSRCKSIEEIAFPSSLISMGRYAFEGCKNLRAIRFAEDIALQELPEYAFAATGLVEVTLPKGITKYGQSVFSDCSKLKKVVFPDQTTEIAVQMFYSCASLEEVVLPSGLTKIGNSAFSHCKKLKEVVLPNQLKTIEGSAFYYCDIEELVLPASLTTLEAGAFDSIWTLKKIIFMGDYPNPGSTESFYLPGAYGLNMYYYICNDTWKTDEAVSWMESNEYRYSWNPIHMSDADVSYTDATCTLDGARVYVCDYCQEKQTEIIKAKGHVYAMTESAEPTCINKGYQKYECSACSDFYTEEQDIDVNDGHKYGEGTVVEPTCSSGGYTYQTCEYCENTNYSNWTGTKDHEYETRIVKATCSSGGYTEYFCKSCGTSYTDNYTERLPHDYEVSEIDPTCTNKGYTLRTCNRCTQSVTDTYVAPVGHEYQAAVTEPGCTTEGYTTHTCKVCNDSYTSNWKLPVGHKYVSEVTAPTCTEKGYTTYTCSDCKDAKTGEWKAAVGHNYTAVVTPSTCVANGFTTYTCSDCKDSYVGDKTVLEGHRWNAGNVTAEPTYLKKGTRTYSCTACDASYTEEIDALAQTSLETCTVILSYTETTYSGTEKTPAVTVKKGTEIVPKTDYTVSYRSNINAGTATVIVTAASGDVSVTGEAEKTFEIKRRSQFIQAVPGTDMIHTGQNTLLSAYGEGMIRFTSSNADVAAVDEEGIITAGTPGTAYITVEAAGNDNYLSAKTVVKVTVDDHQFYMSSVTAPSYEENGQYIYQCAVCSKEKTETAPALEKTALSDCTVVLGYEKMVYDGKAKEMPVTLLNGAVPVNSDEYTVSYENHVNAGTAAVVITAKEGNVSVSGSVEKTYQIYKREQTVTMTLETNLLHVNETAQLLADGIGSLSYQSSDDTIAVVTEDGVVLASGAGVVQITALASGDENNEPASVTLELTVDGHEFADTEVLKPASCSEEGLMRMICKTCPEETTRPIPKQSHTPGEWVQEKAASCTENGRMVQVCDICKAPLAEEVMKAEGHKESSWKSEKAATCTAKGLEKKTCTVCNTDIARRETNMLEHAWSTWKTSAEATVFAAKQEIRVCSRCKKTETRSVGSTLTPTVTVNVSKITLKTRQSTDKVEVSGLANGDSVKSWSSSKPSIVSVNSKTGKITAKKKTGKAVITATLASGKTAEISVTVQKKKVQASKITITGSKKITLAKGTKVDLVQLLQMKVSPITAADKMKFTSANKKTASVTSGGMLTAKAAGTVKITVKAGKASLTLTVKIPKTATVDITGLSESVELKKGQSYKLKGKVTPTNSDYKITYKSSKKKIVSVSSKGVLKARKKGTAVITVKSGKVKKTVKVTVK